MSPNLTAIHAVLNDETLKFVDAAPGVYRALPAEVEVDAVCYCQAQLAALLVDLPEECWQAWLDWNLVVDRDKRQLQRQVTSRGRGYGA
jgi:hypothetical protein